ncbi:flagellar basal body rod protein FlgB [Aestuariibacter sp. A3R04]|uniref:flagellar basal body rod protein FlgB n=1 Tax=Aestuariibacter sp. A3R04 TaxID=2841571 RepID=UPI0020903F3D|nr:flagellar basal body rod protein FlgB [Aestuariibacter sp. A3R04]
MELRLNRAEIISSNLANVDTPGFKARDVDYKQIMQSVASELDTSSQPVSVGLSQNDQLMFRVPYQASEDGNTVELNVEQANFFSNSMDFQTSLTFMNMKINGLYKAIKGES